MSNELLQDPNEGKRKRCRHRKMWLDNTKDWTRRSLGDRLDSTPDRTQWRKVVAEAIVWCTQSTVSVKILMMMKMRRINAKYNWLKIKLKTGYIEFARL